MCTSLPCPHGCRTLPGTGRTTTQRMRRAYINIRDGRRKQHALPVGWWCPGCHAFVDELR